MTNMKAIINKDVQTPSGMLYKGTSVRLYESSLTSSVKVSDPTGRIYYINPEYISTVNSQKWYLYIVILYLKEKNGY